MVARKDVKSTSKIVSTSKPNKAQSSSKATASRRSSADVVIPVSTWRYKSIGFIFFCGFAGLIVRAIYLQVIDTEYLQEQGNARYLRVQKEMPARGMVVDRNGQPLAISTPVDSIWMHPASLLKGQGTAGFKCLGQIVRYVKAVNY